MIVRYRHKERQRERERESVCVNECGYNMNMIKMKI